MNVNLAEFKLLGIEVKVHWSFVLVLAFGAFIYGAGPAGWLIGGLYGVLTMLLLFLCVTLHEYGHALTARRFGISTRSILLLPIGGVANLERIPEKPAQEIAIVAAGPLVNLVLAMLLTPLALLVNGGSGDGLFNMNAMGVSIQNPGLLNLLIFLISTNLLLALFNLLPAFPLDGGRLLRALLAYVLPYTRATQMAVVAGRLLAVLMAIYGIFTGAIGLLLVAFFVYVGGSAELEAVSSRAVLRRFRAGDALTSNAIVVYTSERLARVTELIMNSYQTDYPVHDLAGQFVGVLTRPRLIAALREVGTEARIVDVMQPASTIPRCTRDADLATVWEKMGQSGSRVVAVVEQEQTLGIITSDDIAEVFHVMGAVLEGRMQRPGPPAGSADTQETQPYA
ncbi:site-2 protease family protein [Caldilinea sp.]|uniref:site-2 protease family protein n=1 Tax=Caldilinea sp. TaxID=2293560 RepID=UPI002BC62668|nr:site-2 protease family protein [Anaerolineales bacterium]HQY94222.1 site-2 protease family protein [Caldilinea sp.]HRA65333.1 site-2 protease family protein [Caldilinea sp.]